MKKDKYDISIVIPVYNCEKYIDECLESIINQTYTFDKIQIILINDGSKDNSEEVCMKYKTKYPDNVIYISQKNSGVSATRNKGIELSEGKYILFLDSDDMLQEDTIAGIINVFDDNYDDIDLVSYQLKELKNGVLSEKLHYRNLFLNKTGIYDLNEFMYCNITTINYAIKNDNNLKCRFDGSFQEDQKFATEVVMRKKKIGYTEDGCYIYRRHNESVTNNSFYAYYIFDDVTKYWEDLFNRFDHVPPYIQSLFLNDINWKIKGDLLKPYHYQGKEFEKQWNRIIELLNKTDDYVILNHPVIDEEFKYYFIKMKTNNKMKISLGNKTSNIAILNNDNLIYSNNYIDLRILKFNVFKNKIDIVGYFLSPIFMFFDQKPELYLIKNHDVKNKISIDIRESSYSYSRAKEKTAKAWMFEISIDNENISDLCFKIYLENAIMDTKIFFEKSTPFNDNLIGRDKYYRFNKEYSLNKKMTAIMVKDDIKKQKRIHDKIISKYYFHNDLKRWLFRKIISLMVKEPEDIWLYYDCQGVEKDNGYYQFIHDIKKNDGIKRYFVSANNMKDTYKLFNGIKHSHIIKFNSFKHKLYYLKAKKVITAYIENKNCSPYTENSLKNYSDLFIKPELVYLQHGVLHAHMPWKFSYDRLLVDKEVVSTNFEVENLKKNYCFTDNHLIKSGMPRYDFISLDAKPKNKILFAPSWRRYLIDNQKGNWVPTKKKFKDSEFFKETNKFLQSEKLHALLDKYNYQLEFKLHPIFNCYKHLYNIKSDRITFAKNTTKNSDYNICITDYSSFVFDFVYLKRSIIYFFPDYTLFKAGLNLYRELDLPIEEGFGNLVTTADEAINDIEKLLINKGQPNKKYIDRMNKLFLFNDNNQRDRIYEELMKE